MATNDPRPDLSKYSDMKTSHSTGQQFATLYNYPVQHYPSNHYWYTETSQMRIAKKILRDTDITDKKKLELLKYVLEA